MLEPEAAERNNANDQLTTEQWELFVEVTDTAMEIENTLHFKGSSHPNESAILACYLLSRAISADKLDSATYDQVAEGYLDDDDLVTCMFRDEFTPESWDAVRDIARRHAPNVVYMNMHLHKTGDSVDDTPEELSVLVLRLMAIEDEMSLVDVGCGRGRFLEYARRNNACCKLVGYEVETYAAAAARVVSMLDDKEKPSFEVIQTNAFSLALDESHPTYDRVFENYPVAVGIAASGGRRFAEEMRNKYPWMRDSGMADWVYNALAVEMMAPGGKAFVVMSRGGAKNAAYEEARKHFVEQGLVECVISLPERLLPGIRIATSLVIFSEDNEQVRLVDAVPYCTEGRRYWSIDETGIESIVRACKEDGEHSKAVTLDEIRGESYVLDLGRYVDAGPSALNSKPLGELLALGQRIVRGTKATAKELDDVVFHGVGNLRYLTPANIEAGLVDYGSLASVSDLTQTIAWTIISEPSVVIPRNGDPSKVAVVEPQEGQMIFPSGNLYIVRVDPFIIDPYYLAAYLKSADGAAELAKRTVGTKTKSLSIKELQALPVPMRSIEVQEVISREYRDLIDELAVLAMRVAGTKAKIEKVFTQGEVR